MKENDMISIVIPLYNKEKNIRDTIASVLKQTYKDFELIVVDDGSTDNSANEVKSIKDNRIRYLYKENGGVSSARNYGVKAAIGKWILFLDADDTLMRECLEVLVSPLDEEGIDISAAKFYTVKDDVKRINSTSRYVGKVPNNYKWLFLNRVNLRTGCCLIRKSVLLKNPFDEHISRFEDMKAILEWARFSTIYVSNVSVMSYQTDNSSLSSVSKDISKDFIFNMQFKHRGFWEKCILGRLLYLGWIGYTHERKALCSLYKVRMIYMILAKLYMLYDHLFSRRATGIWNK